MCYDAVEITKRIMNGNHKRSNFSSRRRTMMRRRRSRPWLIRRKNERRGSCRETHLALRPDERIFRIAARYRENLHAESWQGFRRRRRRPIRRQPRNSLLFIVLILWVEDLRLNDIARIRGYCARFHCTKCISHVAPWNPVRETLRRNYGFERPFHSASTCNFLGKLIWKVDIVITYALISYI